MLKKIFSIEKDELHNIIRIFGIKISVMNPHILLQTARFLHNVPISNMFLFDNISRLTDEQKIWYLSQKFYDALGYFPNFKNPRSFNEKLNWMKINYYNPVEKICVDKYEFKKYIKEKLGDGFTIPLIGIYDDVNDIDFASLPDKFVMKVTTGGGNEGLLIVKDKKKLDIDEAKAEFNNYLQEWNKSYYTIMSTGYKEIKPRILIEEYKEQINGELIDYKFHCFHGEVKNVMAVNGRKGLSYKYRFYTPDWQPLDLYRNKRKELTDFDKPKNYDKMLEISKILSKDFPFVRVDFYEVGERVYVGELTFTPRGGFGKLTPVKWDYEMGEWLDLSKLTPEYLHIYPAFQEAAKTFLAPEIVEKHSANNPEHL